MPPKLLILGHSRSGTGYYSQLCKAFGLDVGHEVMGEQGISCWSWAALDLDPPFAPYSRLCSIPADGNSWKIIHVIRNPLHVVTSVALTERMGDPDGKCMAYRAKYVRIPKTNNRFDEAIASVIGWNKLIQAQAPDLTVKVEDAEMPLLAFLMNIGYGIEGKQTEEGWKSKTPLPKKDYNSRPHEKLTWEKLLAKCDTDLWQELIHHADELGYAIDE